MTLFIPDLWWYQAVPLSVTDGDTIIFLIDKGMRDRSQESIRVLGVDTPELFSGAERDRGAAAKAFTESWLAAHTPTEEPFPKLHWPFLVRTEKDKQTFNRFLGEVIAKDDMTSLAEALIAAGHIAT